MNVIVVGAGKVGRVLTEYLLEEGHDLVIVDSNIEVVEDMMNSYDVNAIHGNGASYEVLKQAQAEQADVLIAMTESDEINILSCLVAKKIGIPETIARVRNPEYATQHNFLIDDLGLGLIVNPEYEAAKEISRMLKYPSATRVDFFANEQVEIVEITLNDASSLIGNSLSQIRTQFGIRFLVSAVERNGAIFIPSGDFILEENDKICITGAPNDIDSLFRKLNILKNRARNVMVVGGGKISYYLGIQLLEQNTNLKIVEVDKNRCNELAKELPKATIILGDGSTQEILLEENIEKMDALVTLTGFDEENIVISLFAKTLNIPKIITKVNRYVYTNIFETIGIGSIISPKLTTANLVIRYIRSLSNSYSRVNALYKLINSRIEATEFFITRETVYTGVKIKNLKFRPNVLVACIIRNKNVILPGGEDMMLPNDTVIIISTQEHLKDIKEALVK